FAQAGLFAFEVALFRLLQSWGVNADVVGGHSVGELTAAYVAGVWSLVDACRLGVARGGLVEAWAGGGGVVGVRGWGGGGVVGVVGRCVGCGGGVGGGWCVRRWGGGVGVGWGWWWRLARTRRCPRWLGCAPMLWSPSPPSPSRGWVSRVGMRCWR